MDIVGNVVLVRPFVTLTTAIIVLFVGKALNRRFDVLRRYNISESVSGGFSVSIILAAIYFFSGIEIEFDVTVRPFLLVYLFTAIGINTKLGNILAAGRSLVTLVAVMIAYMVLQDVIAVAMAWGLGGIGVEALLAGTVALTGGYEAVIAWAPRFEEEFGIATARETGFAVAAFGLILGSLVGGPIARHLIRRHALRPDPAAGVEDEEIGEGARRTVDHVIFLQAILAIHICVIVGFALVEVLARVGLVLPAPVGCFFVAILLTNFVPTLLPKAGWPGRSSAMFLIAELSLGILFGMTLINAKLWLVAALPAPHLTIVLMQLAALVAVTIGIVFRVLGRTYDAAVICAGFAGFAIGSTSTAMANMKAVARHAGTSHMGFVIVPLMAVICLDVVNRVLIPLFLSAF